MSCRQIVFLKIAIKLSTIFKKTWKKLSGKNWRFDMHHRFQKYYCIEHPPNPFGIHKYALLLAQLQNVLLTLQQINEEYTESTAFWTWHFDGRWACSMRLQQLFYDNYVQQLPTSVNKFLNNTLRSPASEFADRCTGWCYGTMRANKRRGRGLRKMEVWSDTTLSGVRCPICTPGRIVGVMQLSWHLYPLAIPTYPHILVMELPPYSGWPRTGETPSNRRNY